MMGDYEAILNDIKSFPLGFGRNFSKPDGIPRKLLDVSKIRELGWRSKVTLREGIKRTYKWYLKVLGKTGLVES